MSAAVKFDTVLSTEITGLRALALSLTRNAANADDLVQDSLVRAHRFWGSFDSSKGDAGPWLRTIVRNTHRNTVISGQRRANHHDSFARVEVLSSAICDTPEAVVSRDEQAAIVRAAVESLPENYRIAVSMCDFDGASYAEIAKAVGCPIGTVMSRIHRGRRMLESILG